MNFAIISIATGIKYVHYWEELVLSFESSSVDVSKITFYLLTDHVSECEEFAESKGLRVECFEIPKYGWPEATLLRYREILNVSDKISEDVLIYLDADMLICQDFISTLSPKDWENGIALVAHPGYWRSSGISFITHYFQNPTKILRDVFLQFRFGGLGTWERNPKSFAFVQRRFRKRYVCGGTWMGWKTEFLDLVSECSQAVDNDLERNFIAIWHDESHLNKWNSMHKVTILNPSYCFDPTYKHLNKIPELIRAVQK